MIRWRSFLLILSLLLVACNSTPPPVKQGDEIYALNGPDASLWNIPTQRPNNAVIQTEGIDGVLQIRNATEQYTWAVQHDNHEDIIIEADTWLKTDAPNNGYGVGCRMNQDGGGYYFLISRDGYYAILLATEQVITPIAGWDFSNAIQTGINARNTIRSVCDSATLSLYINDEFIAQVEHERHKAGTSGLVASGSNTGETIVLFETMRAYTIEE